MVSSYNASSYVVTYIAHFGQDVAIRFKTYYFHLHYFQWRSVFPNALIFKIYTVCWNELNLSLDVQLCIVIQLVLQNKKMQKWDLMLTIILQPWLTQFMVLVLLEAETKTHFVVLFHVTDDCGLCDNYVIAKHNRISEFPKVYPL